MEKQSPAVTAPLVVPLIDNKIELQSILKEARTTRDMLVGFRSAVETGTYSGGKMLDIAKGLSFVEALLGQNNAHIHNLQERLDKVS